MGKFKIPEIPPTVNKTIRFPSDVVQAVEEKDGKLLVSKSASPEQKQDEKYYQTVGCAFDQQMIYENGKLIVKHIKVENEKDEALWRSFLALDMDYALCQSDMTANFKDDTTLFEAIKNGMS